MAQHTIPAENLAGLTHAIEKLAKRADKLGFPRPTVTVVDRREVSQTTEGGVDITWTVLDVEISGESPKFDGWTGIAVIDLDREDLPGAPHVVHVIGDTEPDVSWRYETDRCDHCTQTPKGRLKLVVVEHEDGTRKVVGTTCVKDFLGHRSPDAIANWFEVLATLDDLADSYGDFSGGHVEWRADPASFLALTACVIDLDGWTPRSKASETQTATADQVLHIATSRGQTARELRDFYRVAPTHVTEAESALEWAQAIDPETRSDYLANVLAVAHKAGWRWRDAGIGASILAAYRREQERLILAKIEHASYADSVHIGEPGTKIDFEATITFMTTIDGYYGTTDLVKMVTTDGNLIVWWASNAPEIAKVGAHVFGRATVKRHETDQRVGVPQTTITRAKLALEPFPPAKVVKPRKPKAAKVAAPAVGSYRDNPSGNTMADVMRAMRTPRTVVVNDGAADADGSLEFTVSYPAQDFNDFEDAVDRAFPVGYCELCERDGHTMRSCPTRDDF